MKTTIYPVHARGGTKTDGTGLISIIVRFNRNAIKQISTGLYIDPVYWNDKKRFVKSSHTNAKKLNHLIQKRIQEIENHELDLLNQGKQLTVELLERYLKGDQSDELFNLFYTRELDADKSIRRSSYTDQRQTLNLLNSFNDLIRMQDINYKLIHQFNNFLIDQDLSINTVGKHHKNLKKYINLAISFNLISMDLNQYPYRSFRVSREPTERVNLSDDEIMLLEELEYYPGSKLDYIRDLFLFGCYTGLRFSDVLNLGPGNIVKNGDNLEIRIRMIKVSRDLILPISILFDGAAQRIIEKYIGNDQEKIFKRVNNDTVNKGLKQIAYDAGISKHLTFHLSRHTFLTKLAHATGNVFEVMKYGGISKVDTAQIYIHLSEDKEHKGLKNVKWDK